MKARAADWTGKSCVTAFTSPHTRLSTRYERMQSVLVDRRKDLKAMSPLTRKELSVFAVDLAAFLSSEVSGWLVLVKSKAVSPY